MMSRRPKISALLSVIALAAVGLVTAGVGVPGATGAVPAAAGPKVVGTVPLAVRTKRASFVSARSPHARLSLNVGLRVRNAAALKVLINTESNPASVGYHHYITNAQYKSRFGPTSAQVSAVRSWLKGRGLHVASVSPDHLLVHVTTSTANAEHAFGVRINNYRDGGHTFWSNDRAATVPPGLAISAITGLNNSVVPTATTPAAPGPSPADFRAGGYFPSDFQQAYNAQGGASGQSIGLVLWGAPLHQSDLSAFAGNTGSTPVTIGQSGADGINFIPVDGTSFDTSVWGETALDVEYAHGIAPGSHLKYWLAPSATFDGLESAVNAAANDASVHVVSNSWSADGNDFSDPNLDASFQHAAAVGTTFLFATGDTARIGYPSTSPYVLAIGGTSLNTDSSGNYASESAWSGSGNGCSSTFARPSWQTGLGNAPTCSGRAVPDVAADADPYTGAYDYYGGGAQQIGGTSLATPLWAGMLADWNAYNASNGTPRVGFAPPLVYGMTTNPTTYGSDFHDVTSGSAGGHGARSGWDEVTGWGSPNLAALEHDAANRHEQDVFFVGTDHAIWRWTWSPGWHLTRIGGAVAAGTSPAAVELNANFIRIYFHDTGNHISELAWSGAGWHQQSLGGAVAAGTSPAAFALSPTFVRVFFHNTSHHISQLAWSGAGWHLQSLGGAVATGTSPSAFGASASFVRVYFHDTKNHISELAWSGTGWHGRSIGGAVAAKTSPAALAINGTYSRVYFHDTSNHVSELAWSGTQWVAPARLGGTVAAGTSPAAFALNASFVRVYFHNTGNHISEIAWSGAGWHTASLGGAVAAKTSPTALAINGTYSRVYFHDSGNHISELAWSGSHWVPAARLGGAVASGSSPSET
jgi:kumamolisin